MAQLCGQRRGRALLVLLASLLLSGAEAAGRELDFHGEGTAGIPEEGGGGGRGCAGLGGDRAPRNRRLLGHGDGVRGEQPDLRVSEGWKGWDKSARTASAEV